MEVLARPLRAQDAVGTLAPQDRPEAQDRQERPGVILRLRWMERGGSGEGMEEGLVGGIGSHLYLHL